MTLGQLRKIRKGFDIIKHGIKRKIASVKLYEAEYAYFEFMIIPEYEYSGFRKMLNGWN